MAHNNPPHWDLTNVYPSLSSPQYAADFKKMQKLLDEHPDQLMIRRAMADQLHRNSRTPEAIAMLDTVGEKLLEAGDKDGLVAVVNQILLMNPPNVEEYRAMLTRL